MKARIGVLTAALVLIRAQLKPLFARLVDGLAKVLADAALLEARLIVIEVEHFAEIALREAGHLLIVIRPLRVPLQTLRVRRTESSIVAQTLLNGALLAVQQRRALQLERVN